MPTVSVVMTAYNGAEWVGATVASILDQTLSDLELIVVDDASSDSTCQVIQAFDDPRIRLFRNERNLGISRTRNRALSLASAPYVAASDQDDLSAPDRLARQVGFLEANPRVVLAASAARELRGGRTRLRYRGELDSALLHWRLFSRCNIVHSSICFRREVMLTHGLAYDADFPCSEDYLLFHAFAERGDLVILPEPLVTYRQHSAAASARYRDTMRENAARLLAKRYAEYLGITVSLEQARLLVRAFMLGAPIECEDSLLTAGSLFASGLERFLDRRQLANEVAVRLRAWSAQRWWYVLASQSSMQHRYSLMRLYHRIGAFAREPVRVPAAERLKLLARRSFHGLARRLPGSGGVGPPAA